ncbi:hypothetical protein PENSPDRAFT_752176 [Peniophora sp. CONT]|nr:hypothetical protein PENSPDRAFT_752176 [Peniophora sp. CONT]
MSSQHTRVSVVSAIIATAYREKRIREAASSRRTGFPTRPDSRVLSNMVDRVMATTAGTTWRGTPNLPISDVRSTSRDGAFALSSSNSPPLNAWVASNWDFIGEHGTQIIANDDGTDKARRSGIVSPAVTDALSENVSADVDHMGTMADDGYTSNDDFSVMADDGYTSDDDSSVMADEGSDYSDSTTMVADEGSHYSDSTTMAADSGSESENDEQYSGFAPAPMPAGAVVTGQAAAVFNGPGTRAYELSRLRVHLRL